MTTTAQIVYSSEQTITCGIDGLTSSTVTCRQSNVIDNTTSLFLDALLSVKLLVTSGTFATIPYVNIWAYGAGVDGNYTDEATGTDGTYTFPTTTLPTNLKLLQQVSFNVSTSTTLYAGPFSVASAFGGVLPDKWGIVLNNNTGATLDGTTGSQISNEASFIGLYVSNS